MKACIVTVRNEVAGPPQLCAVQPSGCKAAIHAIRAVCDSTDAEAVVQVDATNAFNCLNRQVALKKHLCHLLFFRSNSD